MINNYCWPYQNPLSIPSGWICPRCNSVNASWLPQCFCKEQMVTSTSTESGTITIKNK